MNIVGYVFLAIIALLIVAAVVFAVTSAPDIARYQKIRRM